MADSFEEPVRILSDLHLAHPGCRISRVDELRPLLEGARTVLFNGDSFELRKQALRAQAEDFKEELEALCGEIGAQPVFMTGNHDPQISEHHYFDLAGGRVFLTHGDFLYDDVSPWSKLIVSIHEARERIRAEYPPDYLDDLELRLKSVKRIACEVRARAVSGPPGRMAKIKTLMAEVWPPKRPMIILKTWLEAHHIAHRLRDQFRPQAGVIILGHTHCAKLHKKAGKQVINTGAFLAMSKALVVDLAGGRLQVFPAAARHGEFRLGRPRLDLQVDQVEKG